jgi:hypothetical protein
MPAGAEKQPETAGKGYLILKQSLPGGFSDQIGFSGQQKQKQKQKQNHMILR